MIKFNSKSKTHSFLSNFYPCDIKLDNIWYSSVENAYQAAKTLDPNERIQFEKCNSEVSKKLGKSVTLRHDWEQVKLNIMFELVHQKFTNNKYLRNRLAITQNEELIEDSWWGDTFWGVCKGVGQNNLGKILMEVRKLL